MWTDGIDRDSGMIIINIFESFVIHMDVTIAKELK